MGEKILVTGALGQIGTDLVIELKKKYGEDNVISTDIREPGSDHKGIFHNVNVVDHDALKSIIEKYSITQVYHLASLLSASGEKTPHEAWNINLSGLKHVLDLANKYRFKVFWPSSIAVFGPNTPSDKAPQSTILEPTTMYGITKLTGELLCQYYFKRCGVDVRSLRYPGIISYKAEPGGGTTDYAVDIFYKALAGEKYTCFVREDTILPMMYMEDLLKGTLKFMDAKSEDVKLRIGYNFAAISFSVKQLFEEIKKHKPDFEIEYVPDERQQFADSWPNSVDDSHARKDWGWQHEFDLPKMTAVMLEKLGEKNGKK